MRGQSQVSRPATETVLREVLEMQPGQWIFYILCTIGRRVHVLQGKKWDETEGESAK